ncbi:MAG TPA: four helix bundle protein [Candidatus Uhrbacteria bacterium]|nr:four helix bundle protein [Candidatus Uhrbacteria bacterium]
MIPVNTFSPPKIIHGIADFYKNIYKLNKKLPKQDRFGLSKKIEDICLDCLSLAIEAALSNRESKLILMPKLRIKIETLKQLIRLQNELAIISDIRYLDLQSQLQEISKMATRWQQFLTNKKPE